MKLISKSEWFSFPTPIGEPEIKWEYSYPYTIERIVKENGDIIWFGQGTNWVKENGEGMWTYLGEDIIEGKSVFIPCEEPIYETLYNKEFSKK